MRMKGGQLLFPPVAPCLIFPMPTCHLADPLSHSESRRRRAARESRGDSLGDAVKNALTAVEIKKAADGKLFDGGGLTLVKAGDSGRWVYRYSHLGRRREMGLGSWPAITLQAARRARDEWEAVLASGRDPIAIRDAERQAEIAERDKMDPTLAEAVTLIFEARRDSLRGGGDRGRWRSPLDLHVLPKIGRKRLSELNQHDIVTALKPIWRTKHPTATKAIERLRIVLRECRLTGHSCDPFTADAAARLLGAVQHQPQHIPATAWQDIPALYARLPESVTGDCLRLMILTAVRMDAARGARAAEIDGDVWTIPADRIKGREGKVRDFRVPLSAEALRVIARAKAYSDDLLFPTYTGRAATSAAIEKALRGTGEAGRPHGFRTSFRTWVQDQDVCPYDVAEAVLGHVVGGRVERTYARSDLLDRRRPVMDAWAAFVTGAAANVVQLRRGEA